MKDVHVSFISRQNSNLILICEKIIVVSFLLIGRADMCDGVLKYFRCKEDGQFKKNAQ